MTELQASLIGIGSVIVIGVISYNKWQEHKAKKSVERAFSTTPDDTLMDQPKVRATSERNEPVFDDPVTDFSIPEQTQGSDEFRIDEYTPDDSVPEQPSMASFPEVAGLKAIKESPIDELIDCAIPLAIEGPVRGEKILPLLQSLRHVGNKPIQVVGQLQDDSWEPISFGSVYLDLQAGVQLANRSSPLNELEYSDLVMRLRQACDEIGAEPDVPDMLEVINGARALHQFVSEYDAQLSVNVQSNGAPWAVSTLLAALERQGFDLRPDGRLVMPDGDGGMLFSLSTNVALADETTSRLTLLLDVPRVAPDRDGFGAMIACGRSLATRLDGKLVDDGSQPLSDSALAEIASQVAAFYGEMNSAEIPAGSTRALRLFS